MNYLDHTGQWTPAQYAIDAGWDYSCIEATAAKGVSSADAEGLSAEQQSDLLAFCRSRVLDAACHDYSEGKISLGKAAEKSLLTRMAFEAELSARKIVRNYDEECLRQDIPQEITVENALDPVDSDGYYIARVSMDGTIHSALHLAGWRRDEQSWGTYLDGLDAPCVQVVRVRK